MTRSGLTAVVGACALIVTAAAAAASNFPDVIPLPNGWRPEGIEAGRQHTLYVGSIPMGAVRQIDAKTGASFTLVQPTAGRSATGLEYDKNKFYELMSIGREAGTAEAHAHEELFDKFFDRLPKEFIYERELLRSRLWRSPDHWELAHEA